MRYEVVKEFERDLKRLLKRFPSLVEDLEVNKQYRIELFHIQGVNNRSVFEVQDVGNTEDLKFFKVIKFQCKSLKGQGAKSGLRIIYAYLPKKQAIVFIEIYFKADQQQEDRSRIVDFIDNNFGRN